MANSLLHDCRGGSFTSPPCGEDLCYTCGPGEEALRRWALKEEDLRVLFEDTLEAGTKKLEELAGAKRGTPAFIAAVEWFRHVDADARSYLGNDWHRAEARKAAPTTTVVLDDNLPF